MRMPFRSRRRAAILAISCSLGALVVNAAACGQFGGVQAGVQEEDSGDAANAEVGTDGGALEVGTPPVGASKDGLLAWWRFDEGTGTTASDSTGRGNDGTLTNGTTWAAGIAGGALSLDGVDDSVTVPETGTLATTEALSVAVWVRPSASTFLVSQLGRIVTRTSAWDIKFTDASPQLSVGSLFCIADSTFVADEWRHLVVIFVHGVVSFFVDGVPQAIRVTKFKGTETLPPGSNGLRIGAFSSTTNFAGGLLDDLRIYNRALTVDEIRGLAQR